MTYVLVGVGGAVVGATVLYVGFWVYLLKNNPYG